MTLVYDAPLATDTLGRLSEHPRTIALLTANVPPSLLHARPEASGWSVNDVLAHLRSCADVWGRYMITIVADDHPTFRAINPRTWIKRTNYQELDFAESFQAFGTQRAELLRFLAALPEDAWLRRATVTGGGRPRERSLLDYARWLANHERTHVRQIDRLVTASGSEVARSRGRLHPQG